MKLYFLGLCARTIGVSQVGAVRFDGYGLDGRSRDLSELGGGKKVSERLIHHLALSKQRIHERKVLPAV